MSKIGGLLDHVPDRDGPAGRAEGVHAADAAAEREGSRPNVAESPGFSLHAGVRARGSEREKLEHLARYVSRPPVAGERLALTERGQVRYALKTPYRDGTNHVIFELEISLRDSPRWYRSRERT